ncbi:hypothetical protein FLONG3_1091 [Fusarium longipes]|uniref:Amidase domain-containing protein n=1 Tax=Fusarium longipes TaxID=694270 RepID=A0A395T7W4_9HYPO|nr:hypothetical protein FLONG3_1091 [Fusarium longipes]
MAIENGNKTSSIVDAPISTLAAALSQGHINSVELTAKHLIRIAKYDRRTIQLNAVPIINQDAFNAAQESDQRRASGATLGLLDGIPGTIKDSYKMKGMTIAAGSPAFKDLVANEDAFTVQKLREAGAVLLGRTNMPPMAAGGMQRGVYGRAESPYNEEYLTAAFASGSSNGSATATAASFGAFGMGEETISSGRSPASNNGLVAYTPSRGLVSIRGNWPLFPTCDTVVPHTRSIDDMFALLDVIVAKDPIKTCDFWREQPFVKLPEVDSIRPKTFFDLSDSNALKGKRIGVPKMYIGGVDSDPYARKVHTRKSVIKLWNQARMILEGLGATVVETDFPLVTKFEKPEVSDTVSMTPPHRNEIDMCQLMAYTWDDFLAANQDSKVATTLAKVESSAIFPHPPGCLQDKYDSNDPLVRHTAVVAHITNGRVPTFDIPNLAKALQNLESTRKIEFEDWLDDINLDTVVWPCNADVGKADADVNEESAEHAWLNGVLYSNGNCAIRQFGIPTVSVPMGVMADIGMPVNLTFASKAYDDNNLFRYAFAFEKHSRLRQPPPRTPELRSDYIPKADVAQIGLTPPQLTVEASASVTEGEKVVAICGKINEQEVCELHVYINGEEVDDVKIVSGKWKVEARIGQVDRSRPEEISVPDFKTEMVIVVAKGKNGRSTESASPDQRSIRLVLDSLPSAPTLQGTLFQASWLKAVRADQQKGYFTCQSRRLALFHAVHAFEFTGPDPSEKIDISKPVNITWDATGGLIDEPKADSLKLWFAAIVGDDYKGGISWELAANLSLSKGYYIWTPPDGNIKNIRDSNYTMSPEKVHTFEARLLRKDGGPLAEVVSEKYAVEGFDFIRTSGSNGAQARFYTATAALTMAVLVGVVTNGGFV